MQGAGTQQPGAPQECKSLGSANRCGQDMPRYAPPGGGGKEGEGEGGGMRGEGEGGAFPAGEEAKDTFIVRLKSSELLQHSI